MNDKLYEILEKLPKQNVIHIMWEALDEMQSFNGRSRQHCILTAIGAKEGTKEGKWSVPKIDKIKEYTDSMGM